MSFILFELAAKPICQKKVRQEINKTCEKYNGNLTYEAIHEMTYLHACVKGEYESNISYTVGDYLENVRLI